MRYDLLGLPVEEAKKAYSDVEPVIRKTAAPHRESGISLVIRATEDGELVVADFLAPAEN